MPHPTGPLAALNNGQFFDASTAKRDRGGDTPELGPHGRRAGHGWRCKQIMQVMPRLLKMQRSETVLITGCSTGIGRATAV
jgi:hypothetical protein